MFTGKDKIPEIARPAGSGNATRKDSSLEVCSLNNAVKKENVTVHVISRINQDQKIPVTAGICMDHPSHRTTRIAGDTTTTTIMITTSLTIPKTAMVDITGMTGINITVNHTISREIAKTRISMGTRDNHTTGRGIAETRAPAEIVNVIVREILDREIVVVKTKEIVMADRGVVDAVTAS